MSQTLILGIFIVVFAVIWGLYLKKKNMAFEGEVIDKDVKEVDNVDYSSNEIGKLKTINFGNKRKSQIYNIKVRTEGGKEINYSLSESKYEIIKIGDYVTKRSGAMDIEITQKIPETSIQPPTTQ